MQKEQEKRKGEDKSGKDGKGSGKPSGRALLSIIDRRILNKGKEEGVDEDRDETCLKKRRTKRSLASLKSRVKAAALQRKSRLVVRACPSL
jgi:hypothetical protein